MGSRLVDTGEVEPDGLRVEVVVQPAIDRARAGDRPPARRLTLTLCFGAGPTARIPTSYLGAEEPVRAAVERALAELTDGGARSADPWSLSELRNVGDLARPTVLAVAARVEAAREALAARPRLAAMVRELPGPGAIGGLVPAAALAIAGRLPNTEVVAAAEKDGWETGIAYLHHAVAALWRDFAGELTVFRDDILRWPYLDEVAMEAAEAADRVLPWIRRKRLRTIIEQLAPYLPDGYRLEPAIVAIVLARLRAVRTAVARIEHQLEQLGGLALPSGWRPTRPDAADEVARALQATRIARAVRREFPQAWAYLSRELAFDDGKVLQLVDQSWRDWSTLLRVRDPDPGWFDAWQRDGAQWLREVRDEGLGGLRRRAALLRCLDALRDAGLVEFRQQLLAEEIGPDEAELAYRRGLATRELAERVQVGDLSGFESVAHSSIRSDIEVFTGPAAVEANGATGATETEPRGAAEPAALPSVEPPTVSVVEVERPAEAELAWSPPAPEPPTVPVVAPASSAPAPEPERSAARLPVQAPPRPPRAPSVPAPRGRGRGRGKSSARQWRKR